MAAKAKSSGPINTSPRRMFTGKGGNVRVGGEMVDSGVDFNPTRSYSPKVGPNGTMSQGSTSTRDLRFLNGGEGESMGGQTSQDFTGTGGARALFPTRPKNR